MNEIGLLEQMVLAAARVVSVIPVQGWALVACWAASLLLTQWLKVLVPPQWPERRRHWFAFAIGFVVGALITWQVWPDDPYRATAALIGGLGAPLSYWMTVRLLGLLWPGARAWLSNNQGPPL